MTDFSYQLYSSRNFPPLADTLAMLAGLGYAQVEGYGGVYEDPEATAALLRETGLTMPSGHVGLDMLEGDPAGTVAMARTLGMETVFCPHLAEAARPVDAAGWQAFAARLTEAGKPVRDAGMAFGWHNHDFEFRTLADGSVPMRILLEAAPDLLWEADIAWIARGGSDPFAWIAEFGDRLAAVHVKDIAPAGECADEGGWADVGHGTLDWPALMKAVKATPCRLFVMEHDNPADNARFAQRSMAAVRAMEA